MPWKRWATSRLSNAARARSSSVREDSGPTHRVAHTCVFLHVRVSRQPKYLASVTTSFSKACKLRM